MQFNSDVIGDEKVSLKHYIYSNFFNSTSYSIFMQCMKQNNITYAKGNISEVLADHVKAECNLDFEETFYQLLLLPPATVIFSGAVRRFKQAAKSFSMSFSSSSHDLPLPSLFSTEATGPVISLSEESIDLLCQNIIPGCMIRKIRAVHQDVKFRTS